MATEIIVRGVPGGFMCVNGAEASNAGQFIGQEVMARISKPRNLAFHRKFFALLGTAQLLADTEMNKEQFRTYVTVGAGYCDYIPHKVNDSVVAVPKSISFAKMDDSEFERLYQDVLTFICQTWPLDADQLNEIVGFM